MPWRAVRGKAPDPYYIWLSEVMLQQTTVVAVISYFEKFTKKWPTVHDLAAAELDDVLTAWAGLGYYARARNLHKCAQEIVKAHGGRFPDDEAALLKLPGIGPYTAAAITSIAFNKPAVAVDGNVERVVSRFFAVDEPLSQSKPEIHALARSLAERNDRPRDFTQAFMELGATICTPRNPKCVLCPWQGSCKVKSADGRPEDYPRKAKPTIKPVRYGRVFWVCRKDKKFMIEKRQTKGLYEGLYQLPTTEWIVTQNTLKQGVLKAPSYIKNGAEPLGLTVRHSFTHFDLILEIYKAEASIKAKDGKLHWISLDQMESYALPSLMKKAILLCTA